MRALTLWQPWASLIAVGAKRFETRSWAPPAAAIGAALAIHAAQRAVRNPTKLLADCDAAPIEAALGNCWAERVPRGAVVAVVRLVGAYRCAAWPEHGPVASVGAMVPGSRARATIAPAVHGDFSPGRWAWELAEARAIAPIAARGARGLWEWATPQEGVPCGSR